MLMWKWIRCRPVDYIQPLMAYARVEPLSSVDAGKAIEDVSTYAF